MTATAAIRALLTEVIDYAGLFPPATLALEPAIRNYAHYRASDDRWMLGRLVCPTAKLAELSPLVDQLFANGEPLRISALGRGGTTRDEFDIAMRADADDIRRFIARHQGRASVDVFETRAPAGAKLSLDMPCFLEANIAANWRDAIAAQIESAELRQFGFKLRTGGVAAAAIPPVAQIAFALVAARDARVPIKFTAGLHHPMRHFNSALNTAMHGFINVFVAGVLCHAQRLDESKLIEILSDEDITHFTFDADGVRYKNLRASIAQIESTRRQVISFGSCSFDEPREDLRALGWL